MNSDARTAYFAFGLNLDRPSLIGRCTDAIEIGPARLPGFKLAFDSVATILPDSGRTAFGALWAVSESDLAALDSLEGYPSLYGRELVTAYTDTGSEVRAFAYRLRDPRPNPPYGGYLASIENGYRDFGLPLGELTRAVTEAHGGRFREGTPGFEATFLRRSERPQ